MKLNLVLFVLPMVFIASCTKDKITATDYTTEVSEQADDQARFSAEIDASVNDANAVIEASAGFTGKTGDISSLICDADITIDTTGANRSITITYNGNACIPNYTRTGRIVISMAGNTRWRNAGAVINISFQQLKVTRLSDNKAITISGDQLLTNVSGGLLINLATSGPVTHTLTSSNMNITFDNGNVRTWQVARRRVYSYNNGIVITTTGMHTSGTTTGIAEWGINRFGNPFTSAIVQPLIIRQDCNFRLVSGKINHWSSLFNATVSFGLDASGNAASCPGTGYYYLKIQWTGPSGIQRTVILPY